MKDLADTYFPGAWDGTFDGGVSLLDVGARAREGPDVDSGSRSIVQLIGMMKSLSGASAALSLASTPLVPGFSIPNTTWVLQPDSNYGVFTNGKDPSYVTVNGYISFEHKSFELNATLTDIYLGFKKVGDTQSGLQITQMKLNVQGKYSLPTGGKAQRGGSGSGVSGAMARASQSLNSIKVRMEGDGRVMLGGLGTLTMHIKGSMGGYLMSLEAYGLWHFGGNEISFFANVRSLVQSEKWEEQEAATLMGMLAGDRAKHLMSLGSTVPRAAVINKMSPEKMQSSTIAALPKEEQQKAPDA